MTETELHELCRPLAPLLGTWRGRGDGDYPTIESFGYLEELTFGHVGKPFIAMTQKSRLEDTGAPSHAEMGYLRPQSDGRVELVLAQPSGVLESLTGALSTTDNGLVLELDSVGVLLSPTAKSVTATRRRMVVAGDILTNELDMAAVGEGLTHHIRAELRRA